MAAGFLIWGATDWLNGMGRGKYERASSKRMRSASDAALNQCEWRYPQMYENLAVLAAVVLVYSALAGRVGRSWLSGPILFTGAGLLLGPAGVDMLELPLTAADLKILAEISLAMVLFTDAARSNLSVVRRTIGLPERLLLIGLPLTIVLGFLAGLIVFPLVDALEVALLATLLAPTDAALGAPVVTNTAVPAVTREALNVESGLNDGICVPVVIILLDFAIGTEIQSSTAEHIVTVVVEEIGIGVLAGLALTSVAVAILRLASRVGWTSKHWLHIPVVALAALCFTAAQALGGSGFIACFVGGLLFGFLERQRRLDLLGGAASTGEVLALLTWLAFGGPVLGRLLGQVTWPVVLYAVLSLTVVRMLPVFLSLWGTGLSTGNKLFIGWFGPRGLASIVFAVIVFDAGLPGRSTIAVAASFTVLLSVIAHGMTANPFVRALGGAGAIEKTAEAEPG
jgi:NhaP-type Na+/H+ or K+/H+ antiporter